MTAQEIRTAYLKFFADRGHAIIPRANLVPQEDATTLFTGSGMQPMIPYLLGATHPAGTRLADSQVCFRGDDIEEVGDNRHTTSFEMLGNWSLGDYFKEEQIPWMWEFLTEVVKLDPAKLYITCFIGAPEYDIPKDTEAAEIWIKLFKTRGIDPRQADIGSEAGGASRGMKPGERIFYYDGKKNWWSRNGGPQTTPIGDPCGPDSEMFYEFTHIEHNPDYGKHCHPNCDCGRFVEIGNNVFMSYKKIAEGKFERLAKPNIDFGAGLERMAQAAEGSGDMFKISLLWPIIERLEHISGKKYDSYNTGMRVIADHLRAATFLAVDGVVPSNKEQGYVMRRLLRRAIRFAFELGIEQNFMQEVVPVIADLYHDDFPEVAINREKVIEILVKEEKVFRQTLRKGLKEFEKVTYLTTESGDRLTTESGDFLVTEDSNTVLTGAMLFKLYDTYGFPVELSKEEAFKRGFPVADTAQTDFENLMTEQRDRSKTAAKGTFKGGLGGQSEIHKKYHTATHLMYQSLRTILGDHVVQHGSNITEERLRFDFSHPERVTPEQLKQVEDMVNEQIDKDLKVSFQEYPTKVAREEMGALGQFGDRYGDTVKVYKMISDGADKPFSFEICGGPHVDHTAQLGEGGKRFKIKKEESSSAGIRRIKAVLE